ncbi:MAG TPA: 50S ribosomal protein L35 [Bacteriovoracaceae bacterium]|nr:50S ribosomal protein L35 [Bacteriovoracaceae bacterium]
MPKMKTKRAAAKRFKVTATGKIKYKKAYLRHLLVNKGRKAKKDKGSPGYVHPGDYHNAAMCIPYLV